MPRRVKQSHDLESVWRGKAVLDPVVKQGFSEMTSGVELENEEKPATGSSEGEVFWAQNTTNAKAGVGMGRGEGKDGHVGGAERSECDGAHDQAKEVRN